MDQPAPRHAPYFDFDLLRQETARLAQTYAGQDTQRREALVDYLKPMVEEARTTARQRLEQDGDGHACAAGLSDFQDALIRLAYDFTTEHIYRTQNPTAAERMAVVAQCALVSPT
jgi:[protein-PII] uridylyltransferase